MLELIEILKEIAAYHADEGCHIWFPEFLTNADCLDGHDKQESELESFDFEYVSQSCGMTGDDFSGTIIYPYKNIFIKIRFEC